MRINKVYEKRFRDAFNELKGVSKEAINLIEKLVGENEALKSENYRDEEIARLKAELENTKGFSLPKNDKSLNEWLEAHKNEGARRPYFRYEFTPTEVGTHGKIVCCSCNGSFEWWD